MEKDRGEENSFAEVRSQLRRLEHDMNNPLSVISGNTQLLLELVKATDETQQLTEPLKDIEQACMRLEELTDELRELEDSLE